MQVGDVEIAVTEGLGILWILVQIILGWMYADFASGIFHWAEDRYGSPRWPVFGGVIRDTIRHHRRPTSMLKKPILRRSWRVFFIALIGLACFVFIGVVNPLTISFVIGAGLANEIHAAAHAKPSKVWSVIRNLQKIACRKSG